MGAPCERMGAFSTYPAQISQTCDGKSTLSQSALIVSDPVQISQFRHGKSTLSQPFSVTNLGNPDRVWSCPALIVSDPVQILQIRDGQIVTEHKSFSTGLDETSVEHKTE